jgi:hypothetical protein
MSFASNFAHLECLLLIFFTIRTLIIVGNMKLEFTFLHVLYTCVDAIYLFWIKLVLAVHDWGSV